MPVGHDPILTIADDGTSPVGADEYRGNHLFPPFEIALIVDTGTIALTNLGAGPTALPNGIGTTALDLTRATEIQIIVSQSAAASSGSWLRLRGSQDGIATTGYVNATSSGPSVTLATTANPDPLVSGWVSIDTAWRGAFVFRPEAGGGDGAADPSIGAIRVQVR